MSIFSDSIIIIGNFGKLSESVTTYSYEETVGIHLRVSLSPGCSKIHSYTCHCLPLEAVFNHSRISALTESKITELFQKIFHLLALLLSCHLILNERLAFRSNCLHHLGSSLVSRVTMATGRKPIQCWKRMAKGNGSYINQRCWNCISREVERHSLVWTKQAGQGMVSEVWGL